MKSASLKFFNLAVTSIAVCLAAVSLTTTTPVTTTVFTPPTVPCIGPLCPSSTSTETTAPLTTSNNPETTVFTTPTVPCVGCTTTPITTTVFTPPSVPCIGPLCPSSTSTETTALPTTSNNPGTTVFTTPTVPCVGCTTTPITTTVFTPPTVPCIGLLCPTTAATPTTSDNPGTTVFTTSTPPCVSCPTSTYHATLRISPSLVISLSEGKQIDPLSARVLLNNNFESGAADPWYDSSPNSLHWVVEDFSSPTENYPPPTPTTGAKYLRATRDAQATPGQLILRTLTFTAFPGDEISFNFWIRSKYTGGNTLELVLSNGGVQTSLVQLSSYSTSVNLEWRPMTVPIPISDTTDVTFIFFAFCGGNTEDAIAIDDIVVGPSGSGTPTPVTTPTTTPTTTTTTTITTTTTTTPAPEICGGTYNAASGTVTSPNYPSPYGFDEDCRYKISIASGNGIKLTFTYFNTENGYDFVTVYDGPTAASAVLLRASGFNVGLSVTTSTRDCLILHTSDWKNSLTGWTATYASV